MADEVKKTIGRKVEEKLVDDWSKLWKRWSSQIITLMVTAQITWAAVPSEARELLPRPEFIGIGLGVAALIASMFKQGTKKGEDDGESSDDA